MRWRSHKLQRRVRSTLAAEMAAAEAIEAEDLLRAHIAEVHFELDLKNKAQGTDAAGDGLPFAARLSVNLRFCARATAVDPGH